MCRSFDPFFDRCRSNDTAIASSNYGNSTKGRRRLASLLAISYGSIRTAKPQLLRRVVDQHREGIETPEKSLDITNDRNILTGVTVEIAYDHGSAVGGREISCRLKRSIPIAQEHHQTAGYGQIVNPIAVEIARGDTLTTHSVSIDHTDEGRHAERSIPIAKQHGTGNGEILDMIAIEISYRNKVRPAACGKDQRRPERALLLGSTVRT